MGSIELPVSLCSLTINWVTLEEKESQTIADYLSSTTYLKELKLNFCSDIWSLFLEQWPLTTLRGIVGIGERVASEFVQALAQNTSMKEMTLSHDIKTYALRCPKYYEVEKKLKLNFV